MNTIMITLELEATDPEGDARELWQDMLADARNGGMTLETKNWFATVRPAGKD